VGVKGNFMKFRYGIYLLLGTTVMEVPSVQASVVDQYATSVIDFSSQWSSGGWSAAQTLGAPDTFAYGDIFTSWAPLTINGTNEFISVGFDTPVYANGATIRETYGNGFVTQIDVIDTSSVFHTVWSGTDLSLPGSPVDFLASWATTSFLVTGLKIYTNTDHDLGAWEEIDSIQLHGNTVAPVPIPAAMWLFGSALAGLGVLKRTKNSV
jgi:hypothetical protein